MKLIKTLVITCCTLALLASPTVRAADDEKKPCCPATVEGGKNCSHECCKKAAAEGKVCTKCHKEEKKEEGK